MDYIINHTALYDGHFNVLHFVIILISAAVIAYCTFRLRALKKKKEELEKAAAAKTSLDTAADLAPGSES